MFAFAILRFCDFPSDEFAARSLPDETQLRCQVTTVRATWQVHRAGAAGFLCGIIVRRVCPQFGCHKDMRPADSLRNLSAASNQVALRESLRGAWISTNELGTNELGTNTSDNDSTQKICRNGTLHLPCRTYCRNLTPQLRFIRQ